MAIIRVDVEEKVVVSEEAGVEPVVTDAMVEAGAEVLDFEWSGPRHHDRFDEKLRVIVRDILVAALKARDNS